MPQVTLFQPITYQVGKGINLVEYSWVSPLAELGPRVFIPDEELFAAYKEHSERYSTFEEARSSAIKIADFIRCLEVKASGCTFMEVECPIFEMQGSKLLSIHFMGKKIQAEIEPQNTYSGCCILL